MKRLMNYFKKFVLVIECCFLLIIVSCQPNNSPQSNTLQTNGIKNKVDYSQLNAQIEREMPTLLDGLDKFADHWSIQGLRKKKLKEDEVELRIWASITPYKTKGLIIENNANFQKVSYLPPVGEKANAKVKPLQILTPYSGKEKFWEIIKTSGLLKSHDKTVIVENEPFPDSEVIIVEVKKGFNYDSFLYNAVCYSDTLEAKNFLDLLAFFNKDLNVNFYNCDN